MFSLPGIGEERRVALSNSHSTGIDESRDIQEMAALQNHQPRCRKVTAAAGQSWYGANSVWAGLIHLDPP